MNIELLIDHLQIYNEDELFYQEYYRQKQNPATFPGYIQSLDSDYLKEHQLLVPELLPAEIPKLMIDSKYFDGKSEVSVYLSKHNRYTPPFLHTHVFFEIIYVLSGQCKHTISQETQVLHRGDLCLLSPSVYHSLEVNDDSIVINILIRRSTIEDIFFHTLRENNIISNFIKNSIYIRDYATYLVFHTSHDTSIRDQILEMYMEHFQEDEYSDRLVSSMLMVFFTRLVRKYKKAVELPTYVKHNINSSSQIISCILENFTTITLAELADKMNYSIPYCSRYIKEVTGYTFQQLLKQIRFQEAEKLLLTTSLTISDISEKLGYENPESFARSFKAHYRLSPNQFREQKREA